MKTKMKLHATERAKGLEAVANARRNRHQFVAIRPKPPGRSDSAKSIGKLIDPDTRREPAFDTAANTAGETWPDCSSWDVIGCDNMADGFFMQPNVYGSFSGILQMSDEQANEEVGDGPG